MVAPANRPVTMAADWIERLLADPDAPIDTVMRVVRGRGSTW